MGTNEMVNAMTQNITLFSWRHAILASDLPATTRHVLLTLSCHMNDLGESCFPSIATICIETGLSNRTVITHIQRAKDKGWLNVGVHGFGKQGWRRHEYSANVPKKVVNLLNQVAKKGGEPNDKVVKEVHHVEGEGGEPVAENHQKVVKEVHSNSTRSKDNSTRADTRAPEKKKPQTTVQRPDWCSAQLWADYKKTRKVPLTATAWSRLETQLDRGAKKGYDREDMLATAVEAGWRTIRLDWYENRIKADKPESSSTLRYLS